MTTAADTPDLAQADIGLVSALPMELGEFWSRCERVRSYTGGDFTFRGGRYDGIRVVGVEAGTGRARAARATQALVDGHHPSWIVSCGFAGGLRPETKTGQILVADRLLCNGRPEITVDLHMPADPQQGLHVGPLVTVDQIVRTIAAKQSLQTASGAAGVDMETYAVAEFCKTQKRRFFAVRAFSDDLSADLPSEVLSLVGETGAVRFGAVLGALWKRPSSYQDMLALRERAEGAAKQLANFLDGVIRQLARASQAAN